MRWLSDEDHEALSPAERCEPRTPLPVRMVASFGALNGAFGRLFDSDPDYVAAGAEPSNRRYGFVARG